MEKLSKFWKVDESLADFGREEEIYAKTQNEIRASRTNLNYIIS